MRIDQQPAFILHGRAYRETSLLLECFTRDFGRVGLVARGVRRERSRTPRALLQPLNPVALSWSGGGELATLTGVEALESPPPLAGELLICGLYINELVLRLTMRNDPHGDLFAAYARTLERLSAGETASWTLRRFERDLLDRLGYGVDLTVDAASGMPIEPSVEYGYRHELGPVPWRSTADGPRVPGAALLALAADAQPRERELSALRRWMRTLIRAQLGGSELQAWKMLGARPRAR